MINLFPYTDAHELNLDWVVEQVKANNTKVKDLTHTVENMHFDFDSKADKATTYTKTEVDTLLLGKANVSDIPDMSDYYDKTETDTLLSAKADISSLANVATSGNYNDLTNKPTIPAAQVNSDWDAVSGVAQILNKPSLSTVATSGNYADLNNKPSSSDFIQSLNGTVTLTGVSGGWVTYLVTFATPFKSGTTPLVSVYRYDTATNTTWTLPMIKNLTNTSFEFGWYNTTGTHSIIWMAIGIKS